ncbi:MAG: hypothetical protein JJT81_12115 [Rubellimicrobium sp.]|nr:hypothetical protein [Rubellimicrobium sp.]
MRYLIAVAALGLVAACGDPLDQFARLGEVELDAAEASRIAAGAGELAGDAPVLPGLLAEARESDAVDDDATVQLASAAAPATPTQGGGFWSLFGPPGSDAVPAAIGPQSDGPDAVEIVPGQSLPFGEIASVCGITAAERNAVPVAQMGSFTLYDSEATGTAFRTHYIGGFPDGCLRQLWAALARFGAVGPQEIVRIQAPNTSIAFTDTDTAFEEIKARVCGVPAGQPCGERIGQLQATTFFVTVYERFGSSPVWAEILIHDGAVVAKDFKGR